MGQPLNSPRFAPGRKLLAATQRELLLAIRFFDVLRVLMVLAILVVSMVSADALFVIEEVPAMVGAIAVAMLALRQAGRMLERARRDLADARRITLWAAARAAERGGGDASTAELLEGLRLFDRWGGWLTAAGRNLAWERSVALLASTFDRADEGQIHGRLAGLSRRARSGWGLARRRCGRPAGGRSVWGRVCGPGR